MKQPRIIFLLHIPPPVHGSSMMGKFIQDSKVIANTFDTRFINLGTSRSIDEIGKGGIRKFITYLTILNRMLYLLFFFRPDIVYIAITAKGVAFYKDMVIALLAKLFGAQLVLHFHNKGVKDNQGRWLDNYLYRLVFRKAKVILLSKFLYEDVAMFVAPDQVYYCPNGIPFIPIETKPTKTLTGPIQLMFLSNLFISKGVYTLLEVCQILKGKGLSFFCTFIGSEGDISAELFQKKVAELELEDYVHYDGKKYGIEKENAYARADIFVFPTQNETFGLVNLEAMQYSLPIVSTFVGGIPDIVENGVTGFLTPPMDVIALADKLEVLIQDQKLCIKMGKAGRKRYEARFTLARFESQLIEILLDVSILIEKVENFCNQPASKQ